jgi:hypothetical protein
MLGVETDFKTRLDKTAELHFKTNECKQLSVIAKRQIPIPFLDVFFFKRP